MIASPFISFPIFFIYLFIKYLLTNFYVPGIVLGIGNIVVSKIKSPDLMNIIFWQGRIINKWIKSWLWIKVKHDEGVFFFFYIFVFSGHTPMAYGGSQARGPIGAVASGLRHSHSIRATSSTYTTTHGNTRSSTHWARPGIEPATSWLLVGFINHWATKGTPSLPFLRSLTSNISHSIAT